ncbi:MptD family putative ECF transporter S component [Enterococcus sp. DIV1420a]|uniref:MptD family putative ECF transporter S component n=1 Tax=Enterococcus sp. DIV1420a TaxID=2774672 RepID=UPI003F254E19
MDKEKLNVKDLINIGIFTALYIVLFFTAGMTGYIPFMMILLPCLIGLVGGIPLMLLLTKVPKFGVLTVTGVLVSLLMFMTGHPWTILVIGIPVTFLADLIAKIGSYRKWSFLLAAYILFSMWSFGAMFPLFFMKDTYLKSLESGYGSEYANKLGNLITTTMLPIILILAIVGAIIGAYIGRHVLKKHFKRAGIA